VITLYKVSVSVWTMPLDVSTRSVMLSREHSNSECSLAKTGFQEKCAITF
jgi:hypothetical protein